MTHSQNQGYRDRHNRRININKGIYLNYIAYRIWYLIFIIQQTDSSNLIFQWKWTYLNNIRKKYKETNYIKFIYLHTSMCILISPARVF